MPETMDLFFNSRASAYERHMFDNVEHISDIYMECSKCISRENGIKILDLGCGTGLELEEIFKINPYAEVTGIDMSENMLEILKAKYDGKTHQINIICGSFLDMDFGSGCYDYAVSVMALHHYTYAEKARIYMKVLGALKEGGSYIEADYTVPDIGLEHKFLAEYEQAVKGNDTGKPYHIDIPFTYVTQKRLLTEAGFKDITPVYLIENASVISAKKAG